MNMAAWHALPARVPFWQRSTAARKTIVRRASRPIKLVSVRCLIIGHDDHLARELHRLFLRCAECGRCTRGWAIGTNPPRITAPVAPRPALRLATRRADGHRPA